MELVGFVLWLLMLFLLLNKKILFILVGSIGIVYVGSMLATQSSSIFGFGEFITLTYIISMIGVVNLIYRFINAIKS